jgi:hypothetical protein
MRAIHEKIAVLVSRSASFFIIACVDLAVCEFFAGAEVPCDGQCESAGGALTVKFDISVAFGDLFFPECIEQITGIETEPYFIL